MKSPTENRIDLLERELTPKQWAIRLANAMRSFPTSSEFNHAASRLPWRDSPLGKPFFRIGEQADQSTRGRSEQKEKANKAHLIQERWAEYTILRDLIYDANGAIVDRALFSASQAQNNLAILHIRLTEHGVGITALRASEWLASHRSSDAADDEDRIDILRLLRSEAGLFQEKTAEEMLERAHELIKATMPFLWDLYGYAAAIQILQEKYFDGHLILSRDVEALLDEALQRTEIALSRTNKGMRGWAIMYAPELRDQLPIMDLPAIKEKGSSGEGPAFVQKWLREAKTVAKGKIMEQRGEGYEAYLWKMFGELFGEEAKDGKVAPATSL